jgi:hypothetical protein
MIHSREDYNRIQDPTGKIATDEPVFLLRAQDSLAAETVRHWARLAELSGQRELAAMAREHADKMSAWPKHKTPDLPPPVLSADYRDLDSSCGE